MDEPYLNKYPIIAEFKDKSASLMDQLDTLARRGFEQCDEDKMPFKSYDPSVSWEKQKFYHIDPTNIVIEPVDGRNQYQKSWRTNLCQHDAWQQRNGMDR